MTGEQNTKAHEEHAAKARSYLETLYGVKSK
jgi:hypothetical protein